MTGKFMRKALSKTALLTATTLLLGGAGSAMAVYNQAHENIVLKNASGVNITSYTAPGNAFSMKQTCFGTNGTTNCHGSGGPGSSSYKLGYTYNDIEQHSYHAQLGANEIKGFNPYNPDAEKWRTGAAAKGKNWVQSPGHVGSW